MKNGRLYNSVTLFISKLNALFIFLFLSLFLFVFSGCIAKSKINVVLFNKSKVTVLNANVANVQVINHQIILTGTNLNSVTDFKIKNGVTTTNLQIESKSDTSIVANTISNMSFAVGTIFDFVLSNANAASIFQVAFTNTNNSITASMLTSMGATKGQIMKYNGTAWVPSSITNAQTYLGTYDASTNNPDLSSPSSTPGDYFIVSIAGTFNSISYAVGDWIISDGYNWQKVANSAVVVSTYNGRRGIVTTTPADYVLLKNGSGKLTGSTINDLADVNISSPLNGSVLKYDSATSKWIVGVDNAGGGAYTGPINKAVITDGTTGALTNSTTTAAELGFVTGVTSSIQTQLNAKQSTTLTSGNILVGSAGNLATGIAMSGDATIANTGAITLKNTGTAGTYTSVTTDAQGRVTAGTNPTVVASLTGSSPVTIGGTATAPIVSMAAATTAVNGYLTNTDWNSFNNKQTSLSTGPTINGIIYPANGAQTLQIPLAPVALTDAVNKQYVDSLTAGAWSSLSGNVYRLSGFVGIGTSTPTSNLSIQSPSGDGSILVKAGGPSNAGTLDLSSGSSEGLLFMGGPSYAAWAGANSLNLMNTAAGPISLGTSSTERMRITSAGNVGIGNTQPIGKLDTFNSTGSANNWTRLGGDVGMNNPPATANQGFMFGVNLSGGNGENNLLYGSGVAGGHLVVGSWNGTTYSERIRILEPSGRVGIGTNNPFSKLDISDNMSVGTYAGTAAAPTNGMIVSGNVGIGTSTPAGILDVQGGSAAANTSGSSINIIAQNGTGPSTRSGGSITIQAGNGASSGNGGYIDLKTSSFVNLTRSGNDNYTPTSAVQPFPIFSMAIGNGNYADGNSSIIDYQVRNSAGASQNGYFGSIATPGATNYSAALVWGQMSGASNYSERMRLDSNGNLGIGTTLPQTKLDVNGSVRVGVDATACSATIAGAMRFNTPNVEFCNGTSWTSVGATSISSAQITDGTIVNADINASAAIDASKINTGVVSNAEFNFLDGVTSAIQTQLDAKEPLITAGATTKYFRGDKTFVDLATDVRGSTLTGLSSTAGSIAAGDTVLGAFGKLLNTQSDYVSKSANTTITGTLTINSIVGALTVPTPINPNDAVNKSYVDGFGQWQANGSNVYRLAGNVGIGTTNPAMKLHVYGDAYFDMNNGYSGTFTLLRNSNTVYASSSGSSITPDSFETMSMQNGQHIDGALLSQEWRVYNAANVGQVAYFGAVSSPGAGVYSPALVWGQMSGSNSYNERMRIHSNGYVGIGTTTPNYVLDVTGNAHNLGSIGYQKSGGNIFWISPISTDMLSIGGRGATPASSGVLNIDTFNTNIGINTISPRATMDVSGTILSKAATSNATSTVDCSTGNMQYTPNSCGSFQFNNVKDGGTYMFVVQGATSATCAFTAFSDAGVTALTVHMPPDNGATIASKHTIFNLAVLGTHVYVSWTPGY